MSKDSVEWMRDLEENAMAVITDIVALGRVARNSANVKNRQPLQKTFVATQRKAELNEDILSIARDELNVKEIELLKDAGGFITYKLKPQLKTLGPKYGAKLGLIRQFLDSCDGSKIVETVKKGENYKVELGGQEIEFSIDDLLISSESKEGFVSASDNGITVVLDTNITEELMFEGIEREIISKIQTMRKEAGFEVIDRINLYFVAQGNALKVINEKSNNLS